MKYKGQVKQGISPVFGPELTGSGLKVQAGLSTTGSPDREQYLPAEIQSQMHHCRLPLNQPCKHKPSRFM